MLKTGAFWGRKSGRRFVVIALGLGAVSLAGEHQSSEAITVLQAAARASEPLEGACTVDFKISIPESFDGMDRGQAVKLCHYSADKAYRALSVKFEYSSTPPYQPEGVRGYERVSYDDDKNLIVWRSNSKHSVSGPEYNRTFDEQEMLLIDPGGEVTVRGTRLYIYEYPVGSRDSLYEFDQLQMAAGRGFGQFCERVVMEESLEDGRSRIVATGHYGVGLRGQWTLEIDPATAYLVRHAKLEVEGQPGPSILVETSGVKEVNGMALAANGLLKYQLDVEHAYSLSFAVLDCASATDQEHVQSLRDLVSKPFPKGAELIDYTGPKPVRRSID